MKTAARVEAFNGKRLFHKLFEIVLAGVESGVGGGAGIAPAKNSCNCRVASSGHLQCLKQQAVGMREVWLIVR